MKRARYTRSQGLLDFELILARAQWHAQDARDAAIIAKMNARLAARKQRDAEAVARKLRAITRKKMAEERREAKRRKADEWRWKTAQAHTYRHTAVRWAKCGMYAYSLTQRELDTGCYWRACHGCRQPLVYSTDRNQSQQCKGRTP